MLNGQVTTTRLLIVISLLDSEFQKWNEMDSKIQTKICAFWPLGRVHTHRQLDMLHLMVDRALSRGLIFLRRSR